MGLSITSKIKVLDDHNITTNLQDGILFVLDVSVIGGKVYCAWIDFTNVSVKEWLGY